MANSRWLGKNRVDMVVISSNPALALAWISLTTLGLQDFRVGKCTAWTWHSNVRGVTSMIPKDKMRVLGLTQPQIWWLRQVPGDNEVTLGRPRRWNPHCVKRKTFSSSEPSYHPTWQHLSRVLERPYRRTCKVTEEATSGRFSWLWIQVKQ